MVVTAETWILNGGMETLMEYFDLSANQMLFFMGLSQAIAYRDKGSSERCHYLAHTFHADFPVFRRKGTRMYPIVRIAVWSRVLKRDTPLPQKQAMTLVFFGHTPTIFYQDVDPMRVWYGDHRIGIELRLQRSERTTGVSEVG